MHDQPSQMRYDCDECGETWFVRHGRILRSMDVDARDRVNIGMCPIDGTDLTLSEGWKRPGETRRTEKRKTDAVQALYTLLMNVAEAASQGRMPSSDFTRDMATDVVERFTDLSDSVSREHHIAEL